MNIGENNKIMRKVDIIDDNLKFHYSVYENGDVINNDTGAKIKQSHDKRPDRPNDKPKIILKYKEGAPKQKYAIHQDQLVLESFHPELKGIKINIIHNDGNLDNCALDNLEYHYGLGMLKDHYNETKEWKHVLNPDNLYYDYYICEDGRLYNATTDSYIKPEINYNKKRYNLYTSKNSTVHIDVDKLVADHFINKQDESKDIIIHKDGDSFNTSKENLYWGDPMDDWVSNYHPERKLTKLNNPFIGKEKWKKLKYFDDEFEDDYLISNYGRVYNNTKKFYLTSMPSTKKNLYNQSYQRIALLKKGEHTGVKYSLHRLIAYNFCKNKDYKKYSSVNHINGNPECNLAMNLEWVTPEENLKHAIATNLMHSNIYDKDKDEYKNWPMEIFYAWLYNITKDEMSDESAYKFFTYYATNYDNTLPDLTFDEFVNKHNKLLKDDDFKKLNEFYEGYLR